MCDLPFVDLLSNGPYSAGGAVCGVRCVVQCRGCIVQCFAVHLLQGAECRIVAMGCHTESAIVLIAQVLQKLHFPSIFNFFYNLHD